MDTINRSALMIKPAKPLLVWLHQVDSTSAHLTLGDLQREPAIYLVPHCNSLEEAIEYLEDRVSDIFEEQLDSWYRVPELWPANRDLPAFRRWFAFSFHSIIFDLGDDVLEHEP